MSDWFERFGWAEVADGLITGPFPVDAGDVAVLEGEGVRWVMNLCEDTEYEAGERESLTAALAAAGIGEERVPSADYGNLLPGVLEKASRQVAGHLDDGDTVYLHCRAGWQRSAAVAAAVVARREGMEVDEALGTIKRRKPSADPLPHQIEDLRRWWLARKAADDAARAKADLGDGPDPDAAAPAE